MRQLVGSALVLVVVALLNGCAGEKAPAKAPGAPHMSVAMDDETSRALLGDEAFAVGTTTLTSATLDATPEPAPKEAVWNGPGPAPEETIDDDLPRAPRTWGVDPIEVEGIPTNRE